MAISGLLAAGAIQSGWTRVRTRLIANYWLYVVWLTMFYGFYTLIERIAPGSDLPVAIDALPLYLRNLLALETVLWFVIAMAVFPVVLWLSERFAVPLWLVLAFAIAAWGIGATADIPDSIGKFLRTFVYFAAGYYGRLAVPRLRTLGWPSAIVASLGVLLATKPFSHMLGSVGSLMVTALAIVTVPILGPLLSTSAEF